MAKVIYRGTLTIDKLKELAWENLEVKSDSDLYNPHKSPNTISIIKQDDGNWKGLAQRNGKVLESREVGPEMALQALLTHE